MLQRPSDVVGLALSLNALARLKYAHLSTEWSVERDAVMARAIAAGAVFRAAEPGCGNATCDPHVVFPDGWSLDAFLMREGIYD